MYVYAISGTVVIDSALNIRDRQKNCPKIPGGKGNHFFLIRINGRPVLFIREFVINPVMPTALSFKMNQRI